jgi:hypothetical protein
MSCLICNNLQIQGSSYCPQCKVMSDRIDYLLDNYPDQLLNYIEAIYLLTKAKQEINAERTENSKCCGTTKVPK